MKWFLFLWAGPVLLLVGWYGLSYNDISFGFFMLTREANDLVFSIYGQVLGIDPALLPAMVAKAIAFDSLLVLALLAFRRRKPIMAWWRARHASGEARKSLSIDDSLSSAP